MGVTSDFGKVPNLKAQSEKSESCMVEQVTLDLEN